MDKAGNRIDQLPVGGKLAHYQDHWKKLFPQHPEIVRKVSQGILIAFDDVPPSLLRYPLHLPSNDKTANLLHAVQKLQVSQAIEEVMDITSPGCYSRLFLVPKPDGSFPPIIDLKKLNQFLIVPSFKMETLFSIIAALQPQEWITKIDLKDAYHHIMVHVNIRKYFRFVVAGVVLSVPCPPIRALNSSMGIHQDISSCGPTATHSRHPCPCLLRRLDYTCAFSRTESRTYTIYSSTPSITGLDDQLGQINVTTLSNPGLSGFTFQPGTSPYFPSGLILTNSHQRPILSVSYNSYACSENFIHHRQDVTFRPVHIQQPSSPPFSPVLVQSPVVSTPAIMGYSNPVGCELPHIPPLVPKTKCDDRCSVTSSGAQPVLLHGCISQRMGHQMERPSDFRPMVASGIPTSYQLAGTGSHTTFATSLGTSVAKSIGESLLRQQYGSSLHPQTGRNTFTVLVSQNSGTVPSPGSVCDNSNPYTSSRSQERYGRCSVPNQSTQPNRMAHPNRNLEQSVLCLRNSPDRHVCHSGEQGHARLCFSLPGRQSMDGRRPVPILGRFGTSLCVSSSSHCPQNSLENPKISRHHGHHDCVTTSIPTVAPSSSTVEHTSSNPSPGRQPVPVCAQSLTPPISPRSKTIGSSRVEIIRDVLKSHHFPDTVVDMAANPLRDSSSNVYNSHWKAFALWANNKGILPSDLSYVTLAEYLVYLFSQNKKVNTIQVHKASISSVLKLLNPPTAIQEETLHNVIRRMTILRPRKQEVIPKWNLSVVLKGLMKPPFTICCSDKNIS